MHYAFGVRSLPTLEGMDQNNLNLLNIKGRVTDFSSESPHLDLLTSILCDGSNNLSSSDCRRCVTRLVVNMSDLLKLSDETDAIVKKTGVDLIAGDLPSALHEKVIAIYGSLRAVVDALELIIQVESQMLA